MSATGCFATPAGSLRPAGCGSTSTVQRCGAPADDLAEAAAALGDNDFALRWVLTGGEDHPLLATFPTGELPGGFVAIGRVEGDPAGVLVDGQDPRTLIGAATGWDHYRSGQDLPTEA